MDEPDVFDGNDDAEDYPLSHQLLALGAADALIGVHAGDSSRTARNFQRLRRRNRLHGDQSGETMLIGPVKPVAEPMK